MRHRGTKSSKLNRLRGYRWYDWDTGRIDIGLLAAEATRDDAITRYTMVPAWIGDFPNALPDARPVDLARLEARARRAFVLFTAN